MKDKQLFCSCGCGTPINPIDTNVNVYYIIKNHTRSAKAPHGEDSPVWKGGIFKTKEGFWFVYNPTHPRAQNNYVERSHLVLEKKLGRYIDEDKIVIHLNKDPSDDRLENLKEVTRAESVKILKTKDMSERFCISCGSSHTRLVSRKDGNLRPHWYNHENGIDHICAYCYHQKRMHFNSKTYRNIERKEIINNYKNIRKLTNERSNAL